MNKQKIEHDFNNLVKWNKNMGVERITDLEYEKMVRWAARIDPNTNLEVKKTDYYYYIIISLIIIIIVMAILVFYYNIKPETKSIDDMNDEKNKNYSIDVMESDNEILED